MGQFSLKTNWKLSERLLYHQCIKKKIHLELDKNRREVIRVRLVPLRGGSEERLHRQRSFLGSEWFELHIGWSRGSNTGKISLPGWRAGWINRRTVGSLDSVVRNARMLAYPRNKAKNVDWNCTSHCPVVHDHSSTHAPEPATTLSPLLHNLSPLQGKGYLSWRESSAVRETCGSELQHHLSRAGAAIISAYTGTTSEIILVSECSWTTIARALTHAKHLNQPLLLQHCASLEWEYQC